MRVITIILAIMLLNAAAVAATIHVPADYPSIQGGILFANDGDEVVVAPGTYYEQVSFIGRNIVVRSSHGPGRTIIDGEQANAVVRFENNETNGAQLIGFTLRNGSGKPDFLSHGGGVYIKNAAPVIRGNIITRNMVTGDGAGMYVTGGAPKIIDNYFDSNEAMWYSAGGIGSFNADVVIRGNTFVRNSAGTTGGAMRIANGEVIITGNTIVENTCDANGPGIFTETCYGVIEDNVITRCTGGSHGGGLSLYGGSIVVARNTIVDNISNRDGGGMAINNCQADVIDNIVSFNYSGDKGGGINAEGAVPMTFVGNVFEGNYAYTRGGGLSYAAETTVITDNEFIANATTGEGGGLNLQASGDGLDIVARNRFVANTVNSNNNNGGRGGAMRTATVNVLIANNVITENYVFDRGGGISFEGGGDQVVAGNYIARNRARWHGGGIDGDNRTITVINNTIVENTAGESGGGVRCGNGSTVVNSIIRDNHSINDRDLREHDGLVTVHHSNIRGGWPGTGNYDAVVAFVDPVGPDAIRGTTDDDRRLTTCSSGIDAGDASALPADAADLDRDGDTLEPLPIDLSGGPRVSGAAIDVGCFELGASPPPCPDHSDCNGNGIRDEVDILDCDGSSWCLDCNDNGRPDACDLVSSPLTVEPEQAYWRFEDDSLTALGPYDLVGTTSNESYDDQAFASGVPQNGLANERGFVIDGDTYIEVVDVFNSLSFGGDTPQDFTIEAWVKLFDLGGVGSSQGRHYLVQKKVPNHPDRQADYGFLVQGGNIGSGADSRYGKTSGISGHELAVMFGYGGGFWIATSNFEIEDYEWHHVSMAYDESERIVRFGLDGEFESVLITADNPEHAISYGHLMIGGHYTTTGYVNQRLRGTIDELRISARWLPEGMLLNSPPIGSTADCNGNGIPDDCDITSGTSLDLDGDGWPDECPPPCPLDLDFSGTVDFDDLVMMLANWNDPYTFDDLLTLLSDWGTCT